MRGWSSTASDSLSSFDEDDEDSLTEDDVVPSVDPGKANAHESDDSAASPSPSAAPSSDAVDDSQSTTMSGLQGLPDWPERVKQCLFSHLDLRSTCRLSATCTSVGRTIDADSHIWTSLGKRWGVLTINDANAITGEGDDVGEGDADGDGGKDATAPPTAVLACKAAFVEAWKQGPTSWRPPTRVQLLAAQAAAQGHDARGNTRRRSRTLSRRRTPKPPLRPTRVLITGVGGDGATTLLYQLCIRQLVNPAFVPHHTLNQASALAGPKGGRPYALVDANWPYMGSAWLPACVEAEAVIWVQSLTVSVQQMEAAGDMARRCRRMSGNVPFLAVFTKSYERGALTLSKAVDAMGLQAIRDARWSALGIEVTEPRPKGDEEEGDDMDAILKWISGVVPSERYPVVDVCAPIVE